MSKLLIYLGLLPEMGHKLAKHMTYHQELENWSMTSFSLSEKEDGWNSDYSVTCSACDHSRTAKRFWLMASKWFGVGSKTEADARAKAEALVNE